jgi:hypothetical protein
VYKFQISQLIVTWHRPEGLIREGRRSFIRKSRGKGRLQNPRSNWTAHIKMNLAEMVRLAGGLASAGFDGTLQRPLAYTWMNYLIP